MMGEKYLTSLVAQVIINLAKEYKNVISGDERLCGASGNLLAIAKIWSMGAAYGFSCCRSTHGDFTYGL